MSQQGRDLQLRIAPAAGAAVPADLSAFLAEVQYERVLPPAAEADGNGSAPDTVIETVRFGLDARLTGASVLPAMRTGGELELRVLRGNGIPAVSRTEHPEGGRIATFTLSAAEIAQIAEPLPKPPTEQPPVERQAQFISSDGLPVPFDQCMLQVAPVILANGGWRNLGLETLFRLDQPATTAVNTNIGPTPNLPVSWQPIHLAVNGRFTARFAGGAGDGWLWRLVGTRNVVGIVLDTLTEPRHSTIVITLPPFSGTAVAPDKPKGRSDNCRRLIPSVVTEQEVAENPGVYSEDPGAYCKPFSNPERVLGERAFSIIVRVEQPAISGAPSIGTDNSPLLDVDIPAAVLQPMLSGAAVPTARVARSATARSRTGTTPDAEAPSAATEWRSLLANGTSVVRPSLPSRYLDILRGLTRGRTELDAEHPIQWEGDPTRYQAATVARGHILEYRVRWRSNGYSLGDVASTLTLAPRQVRRIQKVKFEREDRARRDERTAFAERAADQVSRERTYEDEVQASLSEWSRGGSESSASAGAGGFGFALAGFVIGGGGTSTNASSSSWQEGGRRASASEDQRLRDSIRRFADALRRFESTVVTEVTQEETVTGTTEVIRNPNYGHSLTVIYHQILRHLRVDTEVAGVRECLFVPFAIRPFTLERAYRWRETLERCLRDKRYAPGLRYLKDVLTGFANSTIPPGRRSDLPVRHLHGAIYLSLGIERPKDSAEGVFSEADWSRLSRFLGTPARGIFARLKEFAELQRDRIFQEQYAPRIASKWVNTLELEVDGQGLSADFTLATRYQFNGVVRVDFTAPIPDGQVVTRETLRTIVVRATAALPPGSTANVTRLNFTYQTDHFERSVSASQGVGDLILPDTGDADAGATLSTIPNSWERQNLRAEIVEAVQDLLRHLNEHLEFYQKAILWDMDRDRLLILLDGFYVPRANGVSIASVVERDPIAIVGNCLVYRVSAGSFLGLDDIKTPQELLNYYVGAEPPRAPMLVSLPTDGLYAQAIMDECEALEEHFGNTDWVLTDKEPELGDLPPELLQSRRAEPAGTTPSQLPTTLINLQNAPDAPAPTGLQGILGAVSNANAFRDMAGLAGTQANARAAMETAANLATNFGNQAAALKLADIAAKAQATQTVDQQLASIQRAKEMDLISGEEAANRASDVLKQLHTPSSTTPPHENRAMTSAIQAARRTSGSIIEAMTQDGQVKVQMGRGQDVGDAEEGAIPTEETDAEDKTEANDQGPVIDSLGFTDSHGAAVARLQEFDTKKTVAPQVAFGAEEHFDLGNQGLQDLVDHWALGGLISGGAFVEDMDHRGQVLPIDQWQFILPDYAHSTRPFGDLPVGSRAHWHWIIPNARRDSQQDNWTPATLKTAVKEGRAATLSIGDVVALSGDLVGNFDDFLKADSATWRQGPVNVVKGYDQLEPYVLTSMRLLLFPRSGTQALSDLQLLENHISDYAGMKQEVKRDDPWWNRTKVVAEFLKKVRGPTGCSEITVLSRILRNENPKPDVLEKVTPWVTSTERKALRAALDADDLPDALIPPLSSSRRMRDFYGLSADSIDRRGFHLEVVQFVVSNGYYAELALQNESHFAPDNWTAFETHHRAALQLVDAHVASTAPHLETAPIPADAIALTACGLHFLSDAFSAGHMRAPRKKLGQRAAFLARVMHDADGYLGLAVTNGFNEKWRAFGDGRLETLGFHQKGLLAAGRPHGVDTDPLANKNAAIAAMASAMLQLHYHAQKHFGDATHPEFQAVLANARPSGNLDDWRLRYDGHAPAGIPGDPGASTDDWIAMDIAAKLSYLRKHEPHPLPVSSDWQTTRAGNHPPLVLDDGSINTSGGYKWESQLRAFGNNRLLNLDSIGITVADFTSYYHLARNMPTGALIWYGSTLEQGIQELESKLPED